MKHPTPVPVGCIDDDTLHELADERADLSASARAEAERHIEGCARCATRATDARRFRSMLQRSRVPGLSSGQWHALDERMAMLGSEPRPRRISLGARTYWGLTIAAAAVALFIGGARLLDWQRSHDAEVARFAAATKARAAAAAAAAARASAPLAVARLDGEVEIACADDTWRALSVGVPLAAGCRLRVAGDARLGLPSTAELQLERGSEVLVEAATARDFFVRLRRGAVGLQVDKRGPDQRFAVLAGRFRASVVGTRFVVRLGDDLSAQVVVYEGAVRLDEADEATAPVNETTAVVRAGYQWRAVGGDVSFGPIRGQAGELDAEAKGAPATRPPAEVAPQPDAAAPTAAPAPQVVDVPDAKPTPRPRRATERRVLIEVPPQAMSADEIRRAKAAEADAIAQRRALRQRRAALDASLPVPD